MTEKQNAIAFEITNLREPAQTLKALELKKKLELAAAKNQTPTLEQISEKLVRAEAKRLQSLAKLQTQVKLRVENYKTGLERKRSIERA